MNDPVLLRPFCPEDAASFYRNVYSDPSLRTFLEASASPALADAQRYVTIRSQFQNRPHFYDYAVVLRESGEVIGEVNAAYVKGGLADIGYVIGTAQRRSGYGAQAVRLLLKRLKEEGIHTVYAAVNAANAPSIALLNSLGMKETTQVPEAVRRCEEETGLCWFVRQI